TAALNGSGTDSDGTITSYLWTKIAGPAAGSISNATNAATTVTGLIQGIYYFELRVTDNDAVFARDTMQVVVNAAANVAPTANAGTNITIIMPVNFVTLNGSGIDSDGTITAYSWSKIAGPAAGTISNAGAAVTTVTGLTQGNYYFALTVTDNDGATAKDSVLVVVNPAPNVAPSVNAGFDGNITLPTNSAVLNGSGTDSDGTITSYFWTKISGPAAGIVSNPTTALSSATGLVQGIYRFELRVTDNNGASARDTMQITVNAALPNQAPTANAGGSISIYLPQDSALLSGSGTDADGIISSYRWRVIEAAGAYTFINANAAATVISNLDQGIYRVELAVTDNNGATAYDTTTIAVGNSRQSMREQYVNVYPNPVSNILTVELENTVTDESLSLALLDSRGTQILRKPVGLNGNGKLETLDMSKYAPGIYFLHIGYSNKKQVVKKVIRM
ncbi:MAG: T9SS type A sorting domain-containing protein, partial [Sphingobacteriales bacterium]